MQKSLILCSCLALVACVGWSGYPTAPASMLPAPESAPCCGQRQWQVVAVATQPEHVLTGTQSRNARGIAVLASEPGRHTLVLLDPLGRRLLTVERDRSGSIAAEPDSLWGIPAANLLAAWYLLDVDAGQWPAAQSPWQVRSDDGAQSLWRREQRMIQTGGMASGEEHAAEPSLHFPPQAVTLRLRAGPEQAL